MLALVAALFPFLATALPLAPRDTSQLILSATDGLCLTVSGTPTNGSAVTSGPCTTGSLWNISPGNRAVVLHDTSFCLDAGVSPSNNVSAKIWQCYSGLAQQEWYYTNDYRLAVTGGTQCLDDGPSGPQTYQCTYADMNQVWYVYPDSVTLATGVALHPNGDTSACLTVANNTLFNGQAVEIATCFASDSVYSGMQRWVLQRDAAGAVQLAGTNYCLDASVSPGNGVPLKIWTCYSGLAQQTWYYTDDSRIAINNSSPGLCLDVALGGAPTCGYPYGSLNSVQTYTCGVGDVQQAWIS